MDERPQNSEEINTHDSLQRLVDTWNPAMPENSARLLLHLVFPSLLTNQAVPIESEWEKLRDGTPAAGQIQNFQAMRVGRKFLIWVAKESGEAPTHEKDPLYRDFPGSPAELSATVKKTRAIMRAVLRMGRRGELGALFESQETLGRSTWLSIRKDSVHWLEDWQGLLAVEGLFVLKDHEDRWKAMELPYPLKETMQVARRIDGTLEGLLTWVLGGHERASTIRAYPNEAHDLLRYEIDQAPGNPPDFGCGVLVRTATPGANWEWIGYSVVLGDIARALNERTPIPLRITVRKGHNEA